MAKRYRYQLELNLTSNSKKEVIEELQELIETFKGETSLNFSFAGGTDKTEVTGTVKKPGK